MGTRCLIGKQINNNSVVAIYCHWDGYPKGVGKILKNYYSYKGAVDEILALGDLSSLDIRLNPIGPHSFDQPEQGTTVAYHRDRGENLKRPLRYFSVNSCINHAGNDTWADYVYIWYDNRWHCFEAGNEYEIKL